MTTYNLLVRVHHRWDGWHSAEIALSDLQDVRWLQPDHAPHPLIHGVVDCSKFVSGSIPHDCNSGRLPHRLLVCVLKKHAISTAYAELARQADARDERCLLVSGTATLSD